MEGSSTIEAGSEVDSKPGPRLRKIGRITLVVVMVGLFIAADVFFGELGLPLVIGIILANVVLPLVAVAVLGWVFYKVFVRQAMRDRKARFLRANRHRMRLGL